MDSEISTACATETAKAIKIRLELEKASTMDHLTQTAGVMVFEMAGRTDE